MKITFQGASGVQTLATDVARLATDSRSTMARVLNVAGSEIRKATVRAESAQTGLKPSIINRAQRERQSSAGSLVYEIDAEGGNVRDKFFGPQEVSGGVVVKPWGVSTMVQGGFTRGGRPANRVALKLGGNVMVRTGTGRGPIKVVHSGLFIPVEMGKGATVEAFEHGTEGVGSAVLAALVKLLP